MEKSISTRPPVPSEGAGSFASCPGDRECRSQQTMPGPVSLRDWNTRAGGSSQRRSPDRQMLCPLGSPPGQRGGQVQGVLPVPQDRAHAGGDGEGPPAPSRGPSQCPGAQTLVPLQGEAKGQQQGCGALAGAAGLPFASQSTHIPHSKRTQCLHSSQDRGTAGTHQHPQTETQGRTKRLPKMGIHSQQEGSQQTGCVLGALVGTEGDFPVGDGPP